MPMPHDQLEALVATAFRSAVHNDIEAAIDALNEIGEADVGGEDMYLTCCGFAEYGKRALGALSGITGTSGTYEYGLQESYDGALLEDPPIAFAARFLVAYCNNDWDQATALFHAAGTAGEEEYVDSVLALLANVVSLTHEVVEQHHQRYSATATPTERTGMTDPPASLPPDAINAIVRDMDDPHYPSRMIVFCDQCGTKDTGEFMVSVYMTRHERLDVARKHLADTKGWQHNEFGDDTCPDCAARSAP